MADYTPPEVWTWKQGNGGRFANINRPVAGATHEKALPVGRHPLQLYSLGTPNGVKVTIMLEELLALGHTGAEYDAWLIRIGDGDQFGSGFVAVNPNSKIPALAGPQRPDAGPRVRVRRDPGPTWPRSSALSAHRPGGAGGVPVLAVLADGQRALSRRRVRPFLRLCAKQDGIPDRPLRHGGEAAARRAGPASRPKANTWPARVHGGRHRGLAMVRRLGAWARPITTPAGSFRCRTTRTCSAGQPWSARARRCKQRADGQPGDGRAEQPVA